MTTQQFRLGFDTKPDEAAQPADPAGPGGLRDESLGVTRPGPALPSLAPRVRFFASGGLLEAERVGVDREVPPLAYPKPPPFMRDHPGFGDPEDAPEEERISGLVEHAADLLFTARHEAALIGWVIRRLEGPGGDAATLPPHRFEAVDLLRKEQAGINRFYAECLEDYRSAMGDAAANELDAWLDGVAEAL